MAPKEEICPYCSASVTHGPEALRCRACGARHHRDCWTENGGCAVVGCDEGSQQQSRKLPPIASPSPGKKPPQQAPPSPLPPAIPRGPGQSILPWVALLVAGIAVVMVVTLLVLGGNGGEGDVNPVPPRDSEPPGKEKRKPDRPAPEERTSLEKAREILEGLGYGKCGKDPAAFGRRTSDGFCEDVAQAARAEPQRRLLAPITSYARQPFYTYTMKCRLGDAEAGIPDYRFCTEVRTTDPSGKLANGIAEVAIKP